MDQADALSRLASVLPQGWFNTADPVVTGVLSMPAAIWAALWQQLDYVQQQLRVATATEFNLDMIAADFFGPNGLPRGDGEPDADYRVRIIAELFPPRATRASMIAAVQRLTGTIPTIIEPNRPQDVGGYSIPTRGYGMGWYGSRQLPFQSFMIVTRPPISNGISDDMIYAVIDATRPAATKVWTRLQ